MIPFETLTYNDKMLIESVDISYTPSLAVLNMIDYNGRKSKYLGVSKDLFAIGDAVYGDNTESVSRDSRADFLSKVKNITYNDSYHIIEKPVSYNIYKNKFMVFNFPFKSTRIVYNTIRIRVI